jgi:hypothetical protein
MSEFWIFFTLGFEHISDINGYDHILFIVALCAVYILQDIGKILILVTAFTIGHSITLALATLQLVSISTPLVEWAIALTIFLTALGNYFVPDSRKPSKSAVNFRYFAALFFGLIHGLGFSNYLRGLLGKDESIFMQLLAFNVGLEAGQLLIVAVILLLAFVFVSIGRMPRREWNLLLSGASGGIAILMMIERWGDLLGA